MTHLYDMFFNHSGGNSDRILTVFYMFFDFLVVE